MRYRYKDTIFRNDSRMRKGCLNKIPEQQVCDDKVHNQKLMEDTKRKQA